MNSECPVCSKHLRNPNLCDCGWNIKNGVEFKKVKQKIPLQKKIISKEQWDNQKQQHRNNRTKMWEALGVVTDYEPGSEG